MDFPMVALMVDRMAATRVDKKVVWLESKKVQPSGIEMDNRSAELKVDPLVGTLELWSVDLMAVEMVAWKAE